MPLFEFTLLAILGFAGSTTPGATRGGPWITSPAPEAIPQPLSSSQPKTLPVNDASTSHI